MHNCIEWLINSTNKYPNKIAIIEEDKSITYSSLLERTKSIATYLIKEEQFNSPIILFTDKSIDTLISFFGIMLSNNFYTLINPELPETRITSIKETINSKIVLTDKEHLELANKYFNNLKIVLIKDILNTKINEELINTSLSNHIDYDPLYVNFTSGSTGTPKGVVISHRSVIDFINEFTTLFNFNNKDIIANQAPFDFDVSVKDIYSSIKVGATLVLVPKSYFSNPTKLLDYLCDNKVTTLTWAVSALCLITTFHALDYKVPTTIKKILFSGEVMPIKHLNKWMEKLPKTTFINVYGPTEITCNCTYYIIDRNKTYESLPIGKAFPNERVFILDNEDNIITKPNTPGEICVVGSCLALGYYNNKEQTESHFVQNPNKSPYIELMYRTGDLAYYNEDNDLVFSGRKDFQIKYMGHRIELEEIEKNIMNIKEIIRTCCIFDNEKERIYGFYIGNIDKKELHEQLSKVLPVYMIPTKLIQIEEFPLTKNGKIDRKKLMEEYK